MAEKRHADRRTFADRWQDWTARNQARMARHPVRAGLVIGLFTLVYLAAVVGGVVQYHRLNIAAAVFLVGYPALMAAVVVRARRTLRRRDARAAEVPSSEGWRFAAVAFAAMAALGVLGTVLAATRGEAKLIPPVAYAALMALAVSAFTLRNARAIDSPDRRLPEGIAGKVARFPQISAGAFIPGNHRVTVKLRDGRTVHRVFVVYDHIVWREGRRRRLDFSARDVVDAENEVKAPAGMAG